MIVDTRYGARHTPLPALLAKVSGLQNVRLLIAKQSPEETITNMLKLQWSEPQSASAGPAAAPQDIVVEIDLTNQKSTWAIMVNGALGPHGIEEFLEVKSVYGYEEKPA